MMSSFLVMLLVTHMPQIRFWVIAAADWFKNKKSRVQSTRPTDNMG
jgi:hypothetical protein